MFRTNLHVRAVDKLLDLIHSAVERLWQVAHRKDEATREHHAERNEGPHT